MHWDLITRRNKWENVTRLEFTKPFIHYIGWPTLKCYTLDLYVIFSLHYVKQFMDKVRSYPTNIIVYLLGIFAWWKVGDSVTFVRVITIDLVIWRWHLWGKLYWHMYVVFFFMQCQIGSGCLMVFNPLWKRSKFFGDAETIKMLFLYLVGWQCMISLIHITQPIHVKIALIFLSSLTVIHIVHLVMKTFCSHFNTG